jgi:hypothetical protein
MEPYSPFCCLTNQPQTGEVRDIFDLENIIPFDSFVYEAKPFSPNNLEQNGRGWIY